MGRRWNKYFKTLLKLVITVAALVLVFRKIDLAEILVIYKKADFLLLFLAILFFIISKVISALRLNLFFKKTDILLSQSTNMKLYLLGMFYNIFLPGGIGGDGYKVYWLNKRYDVKTRRILAAMLADRVSGIAILFVLALAMVPFFNVLPDRFLAIPAIALVIAGLYIGLRFLSTRYTHLIIPTSLYSFGVQLFQVLSAYFILLSFGFHGDSLPYLFLFLVSSFVAILPITIGGAGARELTFLYGAQFLGIEIELSVGLSLMFYIITLVVSLAGLYYVVRSDKVEG